MSESTGGAFSHNLPLQRTSFVGRQRELDQLDRMLESTRLVALVGAGGTGKTRLAIQTATDLVDAYPDGVFFCDLTTCRDAAEVARAVAAALDVFDPLVEAGRDDAEEAIRKHVADALAKSTALLVLDNCEHVVDASASLSDAILESCPRVRILATSREPLGVPGEHVVRVRPLGTPESWDETDPSSLMESDAVRLFCDRARAVRSDFEVGPHNAAAVAQICHRVEGIPLALELAAARLNALSPGQIADRLDDAFALLTSGGRTALERHRTLGTAMDWSYDLLSTDERVLLRRLAVFVGGWTLEAAEQVCGAEPLESRRVLNVLGRLVDKSFVLAEDRGETKRYRLLEPIRQFAEGKLRLAGEDADVRAAHRDHFLEFSHGAAVVGPQLNYERLSEVLVELDNFRAAFDWCVEVGEAFPTLRLAANTFGLWRYVGQPRETERWQREALALAAGRQSSLTATAHLLLASTLEDQGNLAEAAEHYRRGVEIWRTRGDDLGLGFALMGYVRIPFFRAEYDEHARIFGECRSLLRADGGGLAWALFNYAWQRFASGEIEDAFRHAEETLAIALPSEREPIAVARMVIGFRTALSGDIESGRRELDAAIETALEAGPVVLQWCLMSVGGFEASTADGVDRSAPLLVRALRLARSQAHVLPVPWTLEFAAQITAARAPHVAARLFGAADRLLERFGIAAAWEPFKEGIERARRQTERALGAAFAAERREGSLLTLAQAVDLALDTLGSDEAVRPQTDAPADSRPSFVREGDVRAIGYAGKTVRLRETKGLAYVAHLLANPGRELHVLDLVALVEGHTAVRRSPDAGEGFGLGDAGEVLDAKAKRAYRERLDELRKELDEARSWNDPGRAERTQAEIDALTEELSRSVGLGGRDVRAASAAERARSAVTKATRAALAKISGELPELGLHLEATIKTGMFCSYNPDPRVRTTWSF